MNWKPLTTKSEIDQIKQAAAGQTAFILKHSTRCSISSTVLNRLERKWQSADMPGVTAYYLDLIKHRDVSDHVAKVFGIRHESPQALIISEGECTYHESHFGIDYSSIKSHIQ